MFRSPGRSVSVRFRFYTGASLSVSTREITSTKLSLITDALLTRSLASLRSRLRRRTIEFVANSASEIISLSLASGAIAVLKRLGHERRFSFIRRFVFFLVPNFPLIGDCEGGAYVKKVAHRPTRLPSVGFRS